MKSSVKIIALLMTVALLLCGLTSCIDGDKAKQTIEAFLSAIEAEDYDTAESYLHPERPAELQPYFESMESSESIDFQSGIEIVENDTGYGIYNFVIDF